MTTAVVVDVVRTPSGKGKTGGGLSQVHPATLLAGVLSDLVARNDLDPALVDDVIAGCVTQSGEQAFNIARTAVLAAGFPEAVPATTVDRQCGSSQQAAHFAAQGVIAGAYDIAIACGVESMSRVPMFSNGQGADANRGPIAHRYPEGLVQQGISAEVIAARWKFDRAALDEFAARSHRLAAETAASGGFDREIVAAGTLQADETIRPSTTVEGLAGLRPAFADDQYLARFPEIDWSITPGNSSPLTDGASAALIMSEEKAAALGLRPRARFHSFAVTGDDPLLMLTAVVPATRKVLARGGLSIDDIDAYEVNEAFAPVPLVWAHELNADPAKLNPRGGAIALGHPLGASGVRILATLVNHLEQSGGRYGLMTMCEAGGLANATVIERL
ncbi:acetyl-CoA acetyltransferase [Nocardia sp. 852002-20019_SCH5090214]|jgi:acetyl-CoA acyltransferase|uniref:Acetyl-CoA C-acyltransferase n=1 Tax=Nocardia nova TaxID=37330 RepID=A0A2S5ZWS0_9NOCA|nr:MULTISPECIES: thiolase family protein [Nocardia]OBF87023.1 acetyl-CoA acetyltransferase [Mycobacterium sp. 852002-51759_SCH5129042]MBF6276668.1 thiolase family protein [Nocardia nova]MBV7707416.1 thiolase family protein [Nocardia nova]OBA45162.1 acetyl-CoA acetyltransferase [Nocardia sp. 852002-51101_SCH5132738]OBA51354.1 acetyl-CoA acetyltransferase [Nocardia sp. 852002-20019_SCH5090214]